MKATILTSTYQQNDENASNEELEDNHETSAKTELANVTVHARQYVCTALTNSDDHTKN